MRSFGERKCCASSHVRLESVYDVVNSVSNNFSEKLDG